MRKYIILTVLLSILHLAARGQTIVSLDDVDLSGLPKATQAKALRYWFDDDDGSVTSVSQLTGQQTLDVSELIDGLHTLHYQIIDENNDVADVSSSIFMKINGNAIMTQAKQIRYWFDDDATTIKSVTATDGTHTIDASELIDGLHTIHYQVTDNNGGVFHIASGIFMKMRNSDNAIVSAKQLRYWFDDQTDITTIDTSSGIQMIDASSLQDGLHTIHYQVVCSNGLLTSAYSSLFMRMSIDSEGAMAQQLRYWFDDAQTATTTEITSGTQILDASTLADGLHTVHYQIVDNNGSLGSTYSSVFMKMDTAAGTMASRLRYWFDDNASTMQVIDVTNGTQSLDVSGLNTGIHSLTYQLIDNDGKAWAPVSRLFVKNFEKVVTGGVNRITEYQYWLNKNSQAMQKVTLSNAANPYQLISLLPMQKEPIRSDFFHFEITNGQPMVYAKNLFNIRFHDAAGYFTDDFRTFIDYSVKQEVTNVTPLDRLNTNTINVPDNNQIHWFSFEGELGDTIAFKASQATSIQVFDPDGKEVYSAQGSESVAYGGCHIWSEGTYYVALHDVTGSKPTISLDFMRLAKYDVVRQDVYVVGNGGVSTITFDGNGFKDLYAVALYNEKGDSIHSKAISLQNDANVSITFDFTDVSTGIYDAKFHFTTEDKVFKNIITVEEAKAIELELDVKYPSTFLRGTSTTYTITVTNKGNSTAYDVPMEIYLSAGDSIANIQSVKFKDENGKVFNNFTLDMIEKDSIDDETLAYIDELLQELDGLHTFIIKNDSTDGGEYGFSDLLLTIPANSSTTFYMEIKSSTAVSLKVRIPSEWITIHSAENVAGSRSNSRSASDSNLCCEKEKWECTVNIIANIVGFIPVAGCISALADAAFFTTFEIACADGQTLGEKELAFYRSVANNPSKRNSVIDRSISGILGCVAGAIGKAVKALKDRLSSIGKLADAASEAAYLAKERVKEYQKYHEYYLAVSESERLLGHLDEAEKYIGYANDAKRQIAIFSAEAANKEQELASLMSEMKDLWKQIDKYKESLANLISNLYSGISTIVSGSQCVQAWKLAKSNCPPKPKNGGGSSNPVNSYDPNEIFGYTAESGSHAVSDGQTDVFYTIEFENDPEFATVSAHDIYLTDTLDATKFDLSSFAPTRVKIGDKSAELSGDKNFVTTIDMRPNINAIAQVEGTYDQKKGIAKWHISSLDPMTMEPTKYLMDGVLPVNTDGNGIGQVMYDIKLKPNLSHGTEIKNRAGIVFDTNDVIMTPYWTNIIDRIAPESHVTEVKKLDDATAEVSISATDELSGPWRYNVYVQYGIGSAWFIAAENVPIDKTANVKVYEGMENNFYVVATDSAGNVENKIPVIEYTLSDVGMQHHAYDFNGDGHVNDVDLAIIVDCIMKGGKNQKLDINNDTKVNAADIVTLIDYILKNSTPPNGVRKAETNVLRE